MCFSVLLLTGLLDLSSVVCISAVISLSCLNVRNSSLFPWKPRRGSVLKWTGPLLNVDDIIRPAYLDHITVGMSFILARRFLLSFLDYAFASSCSFTPSYACARTIVFSLVDDGCFKLSTVFASVWFILLFICASFDLANCILRLAFASARLCFQLLLQWKTFMLLLLFHPLLWILFEVGRRYLPNFFSCYIFRFLYSLSGVTFQSSCGTRIPGDIYLSMRGLEPLTWLWKHLH